MLVVLLAGPAYVGGAPAASAATNDDPKISAPTKLSPAQWDDPLQVTIDFTNAPAGDYVVVVEYYGPFIPHDKDWPYRGCSCQEAGVTAEGGVSTVEFPAPGAGGAWNAYVYNPSEEGHADSRGFQVTYPPVEMTRFGPYPYAKFYPTVRDHYRDEVYVSWFVNGVADYVLRVRNRSGRVVATKEFSRGPNAEVVGVGWDGRDADGRTVPTGDYALTVRASGGGATDTVSTTVQVATGFRTVERKHRIVGARLSTSHRGACATRRVSTRVDLICRGGLYAAAWHVFPFPAGMVDYRWRVAGAVRPGAGRAGVVHFEPDNNHLYLGYRVTRFRQARIFSVQVTWTIRKRI